MSSSGERAPVPVGPGRPAVASPIHDPGDGRELVNQFPIQLAKVQRPPLRPETLQRDRLLDWLHAKIHSRVILVTAEAGYGKTTLLADFSRRTRLRTMWYRLDEQDRDWVSILHHLVAAGRTLDAGFAPATYGLLREISPNGPDRETIVETFIRELPGLGQEGAVLLIDDYHLVDESSEIRHVMRQLIKRAPERMTFVIASRRQPSIPLARLRALGEVAELVTADLRFDAPETERLFRETYSRPLEPDVLAELGSRTEGWAASLQLVQTALRERTSAEIRAFVKRLTGARGDIHDYLAEEVVGEQDDDTQQFLMRTSILQVVDPERVGVVAGFGPDQARRLIETSDRLGLLSRRGDAEAFAHRYHPLVRDFLQDRLLRDIGVAGVVELHRKVARWADGRDWRLAAYHYGAAGDLDDLHRVLTAAIQTIMSTGEYELADGLIEQYARGDQRAPYELIRSRVALQRGDLAEVRMHAAKAASQRDSLTPDLLLAVDFNSMAVAYVSGQMDEALAIARALADRPIGGVLAGIPKATQLTAEVAVDRNLREYVDVLSELAATQNRPDSTHFYGITNLNLANASRSMGDREGSERYVQTAIDALERSSKGHELGSARQIRAWLLAQQGDYDGAKGAFADAVDTSNVLTREEGLLEWADAEALFGSADRSLQLLDSCSGLARGPEPVADGWRVVRSLALMRVRRLDEALELLKTQPLGTSSVDLAHQARKLTLLAGVAVLLRDANSSQAVEEAIVFARTQDAHFWARFAEAMSLGTAAVEDPTELLDSLLSRDPSAVSAAADWVVLGFGRLDEPSIGRLRPEVHQRPDRWRPALRSGLDTTEWPVARVAAEFLDEIGEQQDVAVLRQFVRRNKGKGLDPRVGRNLARRLANLVYVEDQGRVVLRIGDAEMPGTTIRRKVLGLLCFLLSRPQFSATRDAVLEAMWPDLEPDVAVNSLNQTVYFLRRVFEESYAEDLSPGYVHHDSDILWLDPELIQSRSAACRSLLRSFGEAPSPEDVESLVAAYKGRFALDFDYEPWAEAYRESLHAAYLEVVERAIKTDTDPGHYDRGLRIAQAAIAVDPEADQLEASLLRLYRLTGAHAAAAEQYTHYSTVLRRDLGIDPPPLDAV